MFRGESVLVDGAEVANVLVEPQLDSDGYVLRFPTSFSGSIQDELIQVRGRDCDVSSLADHFHPADVFGSWGLDWDMSVRVKVREEASVRVELLETSIDSLGDGSASRTILYDGLANARRVGGDRYDGESAENVSTEVWEFSLPWVGGLDGAAPQDVRIIFNGAEYRVDRIVNVGLRGARARMAVTRNVN